MVYRTLFSQEIDLRLIGQRPFVGGEEIRSGSFDFPIEDIIVVAMDFGDVENEDGTPEVDTVEMDFV